MSNILKTTLKIQEVESILRGKFKSESVIREWKAEEIGKGKGFLSQMAKITLIWEPANPKLPSSIIAKVPGLANISDLTDATGDLDIFEAAKENIDKVHNCEVAVYEVLTSAESPVCIPEVWGLVRMGEERTALILMEDLSDVAGSQDMLYGLSLQQLLQIAEQLASLHAWCLTRDGWKLPEINMQLAEFVCGKNQDKLERQMGKFLKEIQGQKWVDLLGKSVVDNAHKLLVTKDQILWGTKQLHRELGIPDVLVHGDFWNNNILIRKDSSGAATGDILAFVDWQISHPGSPAEDFTRLFTTSTTAQTRREHSNKVFEHYFNCLEAKLGKPAPFTLSQFKEAYEKLLKVVSGFILPMVPALIDLMSSGAIVNMEPEEGKKIMTNNMRTLMEDTLDL